MANAPEDGQVEIFGPYDVYECLGVGGNASVHRAKKQGIEGFERVVALKRLLPHLAENEAFIKSFVREARLASQLQHANIIQIYDLGRVDRVYFIAMEFVRGHDLRKVLRQNAYATGPMPVPMTLALMRQLCDALDYAHSLADEEGRPLGIVHRDISPSNVLVAADGHLKVIDFGIAKAESGSLRTNSGRVKGKFAYMSPEAIDGQPLDHRTDIFAAGVVAYEMLTARPLFAARNEYDTLRKITRLDIQPPSRENPDCPPDLDDIVMTALAREPEQRWQSAGAMHQALDHVAKKCSLQATNREIAEWLEWAFEQPLQSKRVKHERLRESAELARRPTLTSTLGPRELAAPEQASIELAWGASQVAGDGGGAASQWPARAADGEPAPHGSVPEPLPASRYQGYSSAYPARPLVAGESQPVVLPQGPSAAPAVPARPGKAMPSTTMRGVAPPPEVLRASGQRISGRVPAVRMERSGEHPRMERSGEHPRVERSGEHPRVEAPARPASERSAADEAASVRARIIRIALVVLLCVAIGAGVYLALGR